MTLKVLSDKVQIKQARQKLLSLGVSAIESWPQSLIRRLKFNPSVAIGDRVKSWDVLTTLDFIQSHVQKNEPILDMGCYASEVIVALHTLGYSNLTGVDLNPNLLKMPYQDSIHYFVSDFMHTQFNDASFQAVAAISVIEHGFNCQGLLQEMSRLLKPGGYFIASFDYWPEKIDTTGLQYFGLDWNIFSNKEISNFIAAAAGYNLFPVGDLMYNAKDKPISCGGKQYTFAWLALKRRA